MSERSPAEVIARLATLLIGLAAVLAGVWAIHPPSALIALGVVLILGALIG